MYKGGDPKKLKILLPAPTGVAAVHIHVIVCGDFHQLPPVRSPLQYILVQHQIRVC